MQCGSHREITHLTARSCHLRVALGDAAFEAPTPAAARSARPTIALATSEAEPDPQLRPPSPFPPLAMRPPMVGPARCRIESGRSWRCWPAARATPDRRAAVPVGEHVRSHLERIRDKTGTRRPAELVRYPIQAGIDPVAPSA